MARFRKDLSNHPDFKVFVRRVHDRLREEKCPSMRGGMPGKASNQSDKDNGNNNNNNNNQETRRVRTHRTPSAAEIMAFMTVFVPIILLACQYHNQSIAAEIVRDKCDPGTHVAMIKKFFGASTFCDRQIAAMHEETTSFVTQFKVVLGGLLTALFYAEAQYKDVKVNDKDKDNDNDNNNSSQGKDKGEGKRSTKKRKRKKKKKKKKSRKKKK